MPKDRRPIHRPWPHHTCLGNHFPDPFTRHPASLTHSRSSSTCLPRPPCFRASLSLLVSPPRTPASPPPPPLAPLPPKGHTTCPHRVVITAAGNLVRAGGEVHARDALAERGERQTRSCIVNLHEHARGWPDNGEGGYRASASQATATHSTFLST